MVALQLLVEEEGHVRWTHLDILESASQLVR